MGFGRSQFQDMHFSSQQARSRATSTAGIYSDDEYQQFTDRRTRPQGARSEEHHQRDPNASKQFWEDVEREGGKEDHAKRVWDEFDDFFDFNDNKQGGSRKDETKGSDYKADIEIEFADAFKGVKTVIKYLS
jgi:DnaJ-class molecular chaperone